MPIRGDSEYHEDDQPTFDEFATMVERARQEALDLYEEARHALDLARHDATRTRAEAQADATTIRERTQQEWAGMRRDFRPVWSKVQLVVAASAELGNALEPLASDETCSAENTGESEPASVPEASGEPEEAGSSEGRGGPESAIASVRRGDQSGWRSLVARRLSR